MNRRNSRLNRDSTTLIIKNKKNKTNRSREKDLELALIRSYPNQVAFEAWLPANPVKRVTSVTSGLISGTYQVAASNVALFATRFGSTFVEYRIIRARFMIRFFSSISPGVIQMWLDEKSTAVPSVAEARERATSSFSASSTDLQPVIKWVNADPLDLQYIPIGTINVALVTLKDYTDNTNFGSSVVSTDYYEIIPEFQFQFRGLL